MTIFYAQFFLASTIAMLRSKKATISDVFSTAMLALLATRWIIGKVPDHLESVIFSLVALVPLGAAYLLNQIEKNNLSPRSVNRQGVWVYLASAILFLCIATFVELEGELRILALFVEVALIVALVNRVLRDEIATLASTLLFSIPLILTVGERCFRRYSWDEANTILHADAGAILIGMISIAVAAWILQNSKLDQISNRVKTIVSRILLSIVGLMVLSFIWLSSYALIETDSYARGTALAIYTIAGVAMIPSHLRLIGLILIGGVCARLLLVEVWNMNLAGRIVTFGLVGALLISTSFMRKK
jgi:hypothetical protein